MRNYNYSRCKELKSFTPPGQNIDVGIQPMRGMAIPHNARNSNPSWPQDKILALAFNQHKEFQSLRMWGNQIPHDSRAVVLMMIIVMIIIIIIMVKQKVVFKTFLDILKDKCRPIYESTIWGFYININILLTDVLYTMISIRLVSLSVNACWEIRE